MKMKLVKFPKILKFLPSGRFVNLMKSAALSITWNEMTLSQPDIYKQKHNT